MKTCTQCGQEKLPFEFYKHPRTKDKLSPKCKECSKARMKTIYHDKRR